MAPARPGGVERFVRGALPDVPPDATRTPVTGTVHPMPHAAARHILVDSEAEAALLKTEIDAGRSFAEVAGEHSSCPSAKDGGSLGSFGVGRMVPEFNDVVFGDLPVGQVSDPVETEFGWHLIEVTQRIG